MLTLVFPGDAEKMAGKMTGNTGMVERGQERKTGEYQVSYSLAPLLAMALTIIASSDQTGAF